MGYGKPKPKPGKPRPGRFYDLVSELSSLTITRNGKPIPAYARRLYLAEELARIAARAPKLIA